MKLFLNSITHHRCPVEVREKVCFTNEQISLMLRKMQTVKKISEAVILQTCNRLEFYTYVQKDFDICGYLAELIEQIQPAAVKTWSKYSKNSTGINVVRHLFEVAAGLDSQTIGENQVLSQVKSAYTTSIDCGMSKFMFHQLFHSAFRAGKAVRTDTNINCGAVSIGLAAVELARKKLDLPTAAAMVIGAGENAELVARYMVKAGLTNLIIANRNTKKAGSLALRLKARKVIKLADIAGSLGEVELVISSTSSAEQIVTYKMVKDYLKGRKRPLYIIDIAVPRDIEPSIGKLKCVHLYNIDDLNEQISLNREKRSSEIPKARQIVSEFIDRFAQWNASLNVVPVISQLTRHGIKLAHCEAERYTKDFGRDHRDKLELFAESLVKKILHGPISFLKNGCEEKVTTEQLQAADLINKMFLSQGEDN